MSDFGIIVKNINNHIQLDSVHENYFLLKKQTYTSQLDSATYKYQLKKFDNSFYQIDLSFDNAYLIDINFGFALSYQPLIGYRSTQTAGYLKKYKRDISGNYTGCIIQVEEDTSTRQAEIFVYGKPNYLGTDNYGLVVKNASSNIVFDSRQKILKIKDFESIKFQNNTLFGTILNGIDYWIDGSTWDTNGNQLGTDVWGFNFTHTSVTNPIYILPLMGQFGHLKRVVNDIACTSTYYYNYWMRGYGVKNINSTTAFFTVKCGDHRYIYSGGNPYGENNMAFNEYYGLQYDNNNFYNHLIMIAEE